MNINKREIELLPIPKQNKPGCTAQKRYYDDKLKGFGIRVTSGGTKAFFIEKLINHKLRRITLGHYPALTAKMAEIEAKKILGKIATGIDPIEEKRESKAKSTTLREVFEDYLNARKSLKDSTILDYQRILQWAFSDWLNKPLLDITKDMVAKRHSKMGINSQARANLSMRLLRALFNFATGEYEDAKGRSIILENPVKRLSHTRAWYNVKRRQTVLKEHELPNWYNAVMDLQDERSTGKATIVRDYLLLVLFSGLRKEEAARLTFDTVDFKAKTLTVLDTKNNQAHTLPLSNFLYDLLRNREINRSSNYIFPGDGKHGYIIDPRKILRKIEKKSNLKCNLHDLRRTFITIAESLDIPAYALKTLLNHKIKNDVTAGYIIMDVERLRKPMQKITDYLLRCMNVPGCSNIVSIQKIINDQPQTTIIKENYS